MTMQFPKIPKDMRGPLRRAVEDGTTNDVIEAVRPLVAVDPATGCWVWQRRIDSSGYPIAIVGTKHKSVHRLVMGEPACAVVHHVCARTACVNPDHLQAVTQRENIAEMLARNAYLTRIAVLEDALRDIDPTHPLLDSMLPALHPVTTADYVA